MMMAAWIPRAAQSRSASGMAVAGTISTAMSTGSGTSLSEAYMGVPSATRLLGFDEMHRAAILTLGGCWRATP